MNNTELNTLTSSHGFKSISLKVANMRKPDEFTLYPYGGGDEVQLQSDKRFIILNLKTGKAKINKNGVNYATRLHLQIRETIIFEMNKDALNSITSFLWHNEGAEGGNTVISWENKELFETK